MCIKKTALVGAAVGGLLGAASAQANVIYNWHSTSPGQHVTATGGQLVVTDAAYAAGSVNFHVNDFNYPGLTSNGVKYRHHHIINSPVVAAEYDFSQQGQPVPGVSDAPGARYFGDSGFPFAADLNFNQDGTLDGNLFLYDVSDETSAAGTGENWSVFGYGSDYFSGADYCGGPGCSGGTGYWALAGDPVTNDPGAGDPVSSDPVGDPPADVQGPNVWALFGLAALGVLGMTRRRSHKPVAA